MELRMQNWEYKKLGDVCIFTRGLTYSKNDEVETSSNGVLRSNNVDLTTSKLDLTEIKYISDSIIIDDSKKVKKGSLLICTANGSKAHLGKVALIDDDYDYAFGGFMGLLTPNKDVYPEYFYYQLISDKYKDFIKSLSDGANINNLKFQDLSKFEIPLPPLEEQKRIVKILDEKFAMLETVKANAKTNLQNAKDLFQSQLTKAFSNTTWEKKRLQDCTSIIGDGLHGTPKYDEDGEYYFINGSNLTTTDIIFTPETKRVNESEYQKYKVELNENTVFLSINGSTLGKRTAFYKGEPVILGKSACYINVKECLNKYYLKHYFSSNIFQEYAWKEKTGAAIPNLGLKAMRDLPIPLPPLSEQKRIVEQLDSLNEKVRSLEEIYTKQLANCDELKQAFLKKAFNGEL